jgi:hypothetical protein
MQRTLKREFKELEIVERYGFVTWHWESVQKMRGILS